MYLIKKRYEHIKIREKLETISLKQKFGLMFDFSDKCE